MTSILTKEDHWYGSLPLLGPTKEVIANEGPPLLPRHKTPVKECLNAASGVRSGISSSIPGIQHHEQRGNHIPYQILLSG